MPVLSLPTQLAPPFDPHRSGLFFAQPTVRCAGVPAPHGSFPEPERDCFATAGVAARCPHEGDARKDLVLRGRARISPKVIFLGHAHDAADVTDREAATVGAVLPSHHIRTGGRSCGAGSMRCVLVLGLLISLGVPASAATVHHSRSRPHVIVRPSQGVAIPPGWYKFPGYPPIPPEENRNLDPSNFGGA